MTDSTTTTAADNGVASTKDEKREHPVAVLRREEGRGLISLAGDALLATADLIRHLHEVLYGPQGVVPIGELKEALSNARACLHATGGYLGQLDVVLDSAVPPDWEPQILEPPAHW